MAVASVTMGMIMGVRVMIVCVIVRHATVYSAGDFEYYYRGSGAVEPVSQFVFCFGIEPQGG
jgi:uncharacterized membrane protein (DUF485 family)